MTVKDCVQKILTEEPHLSNQAIADKVKHLMNSNTTAKNVAWYKWKLQSKNELPEITLSDDEEELAYELGEGADEKDIEDWSKAEDLVVKYERSKGAKAMRISGNHTPGYDIVSEYTTGEKRLIEVKSKRKGKKTWVNLTANETNCLLNTSDYWLYIVERSSDESVQIVEIPRIDLLKSVKIKLHGRISNLSGYNRINFES